MSTPVQNLLIQKKVWRFVGFVSTPVGLLCFALSSSFKQLFGEWNFLKIFVYTGVCSIICSLMLFANKLQLSWSLLLKAQAGFLAFMLTSYYSFIYGQKVNGKPDTCSLISSVAFALMSLSLSRQIDLGFEVDLFNFFLGYLLVQLMTIHLMLAFVGAVFCYLLVYLRSYLDSQAQNATTTSVEQVALEIDGSNQLQVEAGSEFSKEHLYVILGIEEKREEKVIFPINMEAKIKDAVVAGFVEECCHVYLTWRKQILDEKMLKIGLHKLDIKEIINVPLDYIDKKIQRWIMASDYVLRVLLPDERKLSNCVFLGCSPYYADLCFMELCKGSMTQLLNFANAVAIGTGSPVRLFRILKVFEALRDLLPDMESLFYDQYSVTLRDEAITILGMLRDAIKGVFMDLENLICQNEPSIGVVPGGGIHPITHYITNYLGAACKSLRTLEQVFENHHGIGLSTSSSALFFQVARIVELLEKNLEANSKMYKDSALCFVFMVNNERYIVKSVKHSKLGEVLGDNWIQNHTAQFHQCLENYKTSSWDQVFGMLHLDDESLACGLIVESFKQKLSRFILQFEGICEMQSTWVIFDERLRERIKSSLKKTYLPKYENFTAMFLNVMVTQEDNNMCSDFGFGIQDIVAGLEKLFQGRDELKKHRNMQPTWTAVLLDIKDFHKYWRKRGQKTFLDSSYPIDYYWCVHKLNQGCQASVQVQQIQEDPPMYETRYTSLHTCTLRANVPQMLTEKPRLMNQ